MGQSQCEKNPMLVVPVEPIKHVLHLRRVDGRVENRNEVCQLIVNHRAGNERRVPRVLAHNCNH